MIIGITGRMGVGKTTSANFIASKISSACIIPFAKPLKEYAKTLGWDGNKDKKGRKLLKLLGTDCGRKCICNDIWVDKWFEQIQKRYKHERDIVILCDDVRFENEAKMIKDQQGYIIQITGRRRGRKLDWLVLIGLKITEFLGICHPSEQGIPNRYVDFIIENKGTIEDLKFELDKMLIRIGALDGTV
jgi:hypothetical protein